MTITERRYDDFGITIAEYYSRLEQGREYLGGTETILKPRSKPYTIVPHTDSTEKLSVLVFKNKETGVIEADIASQPLVKGRGLGNLVQGIVRQLSEDSLRVELGEGNNKLPHHLEHQNGLCFLAIEFIKNV